MYVAERKARALASELGWEIYEAPNGRVYLDLMAANGRELVESIYVWTKPSDDILTDNAYRQLECDTCWKLALFELQDRRDTMELAKMVAESIHSDTNI